MLISLCPLLAFGRAVNIIDMRTLITQSSLVFVGRIQSIQASGIKTEMSYPTWKGVTFEWLYCSVEVIEPIKGVQKNESVKTALLSAPDGGISFNPPGIIQPEEGAAYLFCLAPTTISNTFAAVTAPWDDNQAIFVLDRDFWLYGNYRKGHRDGLPVLNERYVVLWSLVGDNKALTPAGAETLRKTYQDAISTPPPTNLIIQLQWETHKSPSGWQWDIPKGHEATTNSSGPMTMPAFDCGREDLWKH